MYTVTLTLPFQSYVPETDMSETIAHSGKLGAVHDNVPCLVVVPLAVNEILALTDVVAISSPP